MGGCLEIKLSPWMRVAITRVFALGPALLVAVTTYGNQKLFNTINEYLNVLQSVQLPFAMLPVLHFAAQPDLLSRFRSGTFLTVVSSLVATGVMFVNVLLIVQFVTDPDKNFTAGSVTVVCLYGCFYFFVCFRMVKDELLAIANYAMGLVGLSRNARVHNQGLREALTQPEDILVTPISNNANK